MPHGTEHLTVRARRRHTGAHAQQARGQERALAADAGRAVRRLDRGRRGRRRPLRRAHRRRRRLLRRHGPQGARGRRRMEGRAVPGPAEGRPRPALEGDAAPPPPAQTGDRRRRGPLRRRRHRDPPGHRHPGRGPRRHLRAVRGQARAVPHRRLHGPAASARSPRTHALEMLLTGRPYARRGGRADRADRPGRPRRDRAGEGPGDRRTDQRLRPARRRGGQGVRLRDRRDDRDRWPRVRTRARLADLRHRRRQGGIAGFRGEAPARSTARDLAGPRPCQQKETPHDIAPAPEVLGHRSSSSTPSPAPSARSRRLPHRPARATCSAYGPPTAGCSCRPSSTTRSPPRSCPSWSRSAPAARSPPGRGTRPRAAASP